MICVAFYSISFRGDEVGIYVWCSWCKYTNLIVAISLRKYGLDNGGGVKFIENFSAIGYMIIIYEYQTDIKCRSFRCNTNCTRASAGRLMDQVAVMYIPWSIFFLTFSNAINFWMHIFKYDYTISNFISKQTSNSWPSDQSIDRLKEWQI